jgi:hypothetical protein
VNAPVDVTVPPGVVRTTFTRPDASAGVTHVTDESLSTLIDVAATPPKVTPLVPVNPVPDIVTVVPPNVTPLLGFTPEIVGTGTTTLKFTCTESLPAELVAVIIMLYNIPDGVPDTTPVDVSIDNPVGSTVAE